MRKLLCFALLMFVVTVGSACMPYHATIPGVIDLRPQGTSGTPSGLIEAEKLRFWTLYVIQLGDWDAGQALQLSEGTGLTNVRWQSRYSLLDLLVNVGATAVIGGVVAALGAPPYTFPTSLILASRTLRIEAAVVNLSAQAPTDSGSKLAGEPDGKEEDPSVEVAHDGEVEP